MKLQEHKSNSGASITVIIPKDIVELFNLKKGDTVLVSADLEKEAIIIKKIDKE